MNSFLDFINADIESKKTFIQSLPTNNKTNQKKYNQKIDDILKSYNYYKDAVTKYINAKSESFKYKPSKPDIDKITNTLNEFKDMLFIFNENNSYNEKLKLDATIYNLHTYSEYTFEDINLFIRDLLDKFKKAGVILKSEDFQLTSYVNKYMKAYFESKNSFDNLSKVFEEIYWFNHDIIKHIELNFIILIEKYKKNFDNYIIGEKKKILDSMKVKSKDELYLKYEEVYQKYNECLDEDIADIVEKAKNNEIDINNYFEDSKFRTNTFAELTVNEVNYGDSSSVEKLLSVLEKLKQNTVEYKNYLKFLPLFNYFKDKYSKMKTSSDIDNDIKRIEKDVNALCAKINKLNGNISNPIQKAMSLISKKENVSSSESNDEVLTLANKLYDLYVNKNKLCFEKYISKLHAKGMIFVSDVMSLFYSFSYFKVEIFKEIFETENSEQLSQLCDEFDDFASNPTNIITKGINISEDLDMATIISDRYRMENINLLPEDLDEDNLDALINKIEFVKRIYKIENSTLSVEKIWFIVQNLKIINSKKEK